VAWAVLDVESHHVMFDSSFPIPFGREDLEPLTVEAVSIQLHASRAFVRLCLNAGCRTRHERLSVAELLHWLFEHYAEVRALAGLKPFADVTGVAPETELRLRMANALFTLLEFNESRASDNETRREIRKVWRLVEKSVEKA
jgi:hypothetical protein